MWYVYFLELANGDIYAGSTDELRLSGRRPPYGVMNSQRERQAQLFPSGPVGSIRDQVVFNRLL